MILNREQIDGHGAVGDPIEALDRLIATARAYHDLRDAVLLNASLSQLLAVIARLERGES